MKKIILSLAAFVLSFAAQSQSTGELFKFSDYNFSLSTARSAAMGGAFTSLGADAVSMSLNPAGLGMYSSSSVSISPGLRITSDRSMFAQYPVSDNNYTKFTVGNFAFTYRAPNGFVLGFGMNRLADFANKSYVEGNYSLKSMAYIFRDQLSGQRVSSITGKYAFDRPPVQWGAVMGYEAWLVDPVIDVPGNTDYSLDNVINDQDRVASSLSQNINGAVDEITLSGAYDFNGVLYIGATLGLQTISYHQKSTYREFASPENTGTLQEFAYSDVLNMSGTGFNIKLGATLRPVQWLRIGVAYHSPTWISMGERSTQYMDVWLKGYDTGSSYTPDLVQNYNMSTPSRLMAGISASISRYAIISFDYERVWYNAMRFDTPINVNGYRAPIAPTDIDNLPNSAAYMDARGDINLNGIIEANYRAVNKFRVGLEVQPVQGLFVRGGWAHSESPYQLVDSFYKQGAKLSDYGARTQWSGGVGYRNGQFSIDLAYVNSSYKTLPSVFYDYVPQYDYGHIVAGKAILPEDNNYHTITDHNIILTLGFRF